MSNRKYISSLEVAAESLAQSRVIVESDRNRSKHVRAAAMKPRKEWYDVPFYLVAYGANGVRFTVAVSARKSAQEPDGISVMHDGADGRGTTVHYYPMIADLPAEVRPIVRDVQAGLGFETTAAEKSREKRRAKRNAEHDAYMAKRHPEWFGADGKLDHDKMNASVDRMAKAEEARNAEIAVATDLARRSHEAECAAVQKRISWSEFTATRAILDAHPMRHYAHADFDAEHKCKGLSTCRYRAPVAADRSEPSGDTQVAS